MITKSDLILRDLDLLKSINKKAKCVVQMTLTTYDEALCHIIEPNVCTTARRFEVLKILQESRIPVIVWMTPVLPYINDTKENLGGILDYCIRSGVKGIICFNAGMTLRDGDREYYYQALDRYFPGLRSVYQNQYGNSYHVLSERNEELMALFPARCEENGIIHNVDECFRYVHELPEKYEQLSFN